MMRLSLLLSLSALLWQPAAAELLAVFSVQRHGARNVLPKTALMKESDARGGPALLPEGQRQAYSAGVAFKKRYIDAATCQNTTTCLVGAAASHYGQVMSDGVAFSNYNTYINSSGLDRTIQTALSFLAGVFDQANNVSETRFLPTGAAVVPVYSVDDSQDYVVRGYTKCPAYDAKLEAWYASPDFRAKEEESAALRDSVAATLASTDTSLQNWWNVYDSFNVWRSFGVGDPTPAVDNSTFAEMQALGYWLETSKMHSTLTGSMLGGPLLQAVSDALQAAALAAATGNATSQVYYKLRHVSAHYNTQLGLLSALGLDTYAPAAATPWLRKLPALAALVAFELHLGSAGEMEVRLVMQDGPAAEYQTIPLPCSDGSEGSCSLEAFQAHIRPRALAGVGAWCAACQNNATAACQARDLAATVAQLKQGGAGGMVPAGETAPSCSSDGWKIAVAAIVAALGTLAVCGLALAVLHQRRRRRAATAPPEQEIAKLHLPLYSA